MRMDPHFVAHDQPTVVALAPPRRRRDYRAPVLLLVALLAAGLAVADRPPLPVHGISAAVA